MILLWVKNERKSRRLLRCACCGLSGRKGIEGLSMTFSCFSRQDNDGVLGDVDNLFRKLQPLVVRREVEDTLSWRESNNANFSIISLYCSYSRGPRDPFPISIV